MSMIASFRRWLHRKQYHFEVTFSVYMFTPWEKFAFYSIVFLLFSLTFIAAILYLPHHVSILAGRAWYYIKGDHIDMAASARGVVKDMSAGLHDAGAAAASAATAAAVGDATTKISTTAEAVESVAKEVVETVVKEL